jgi:hypothetical protein
VVGHVPAGVSRARALSRQLPRRRSGVQPLRRRHRNSSRDHGVTRGRCRGAPGLAGESQRPRARDRGHQHGS